MGVSGSGKSTIAKKLATSLSFDYLEADDFHSEGNIEKMRSGIPLTDDDRWPWLSSIKSYILNRVDLDFVLACSALKQSYRDFLLEDFNNYRLIYLKGDFEIIEDRLKKRKAHFMPERLLRDQFNTLEEPVNATIFNVSHLSPEEIISELIDNVNI